MPDEEVTPEAKAFQGEIWQAIVFAKQKEGSVPAAIVLSPDARALLIAGLPEATYVRAAKEGEEFLMGCRVEQDFELEGRVFSLKWP
jgi:hypothetical protein